jgi:electron transfer flavoprotein alpha subunit
MAVLLLGEVTDGQLALDATAKAVTAAQALGPVTVLCAGARAAEAGAAAAKIDGVAKVLVAEDASLGHRLAEPTAALIVGLAGDYEHIVAPATSTVTSEPIWPAAVTALATLARSVLPSCAATTRIAMIRSPPLRCAACRRARPPSSP